MKHISEFIFKIYNEVLNIYKELLSTLNVGNLYFSKYVYAYVWWYMKVSFSVVSYKERHLQTLTLLLCHSKQKKSSLEYKVGQRDP